MLTDVFLCEQCDSVYLYGVAMVLHADRCVSMPTDVHGGVGTVLDLFLRGRRRFFLVVRILQVVR